MGSINTGPPIPGNVPSKNHSLNFGGNTEKQKQRCNRKATKSKGKQKNIVCHALRT